MGSYLCRAAARRRVKVFSSYMSHQFAMEGVHAFPLDLTQKELVLRRLADLRPEKIIHCAAITYETDSNLLHEVNLRGTEHLLSYCRSSGAYLLYVSTDLAFDGGKGCYREEDPVNPVGNYPQSKVLGEESVQNSGMPWSIARIPINYGWTPGNNSFIEWILGKVQSREPVPLFTDQYRSPIYLGSLAKALLEIASRELGGIFHLAGHDRVSRYEVGQKAAEIFGFPQSLLSPVSMSDVQYSGSRCRDCSLDTGRARLILDAQLPGIEEGMRMMKEEENPYRESWTFSGP